MVSAAKFLPLVSQLGSYLKLGLDYYADLKMAGREAGPEIIALYLRAKIDPWEPTLGSRVLLDSPTKDAAARFLAGIIVNFAGVP